MVSRAWRSALTSRCTCTRAHCPPAFLITAEVGRFRALMIGPGSEDAYECEALRSGLLGVDVPRCVDLAAGRRILLRERHPHAPGPQKNCCPPPFSSSTLARISASTVRLASCTDCSGGIASIRRDRREETGGCTCPRCFRDLRPLLHSAPRARRRDCARGPLEHPHANASPRLLTLFIHHQLPHAHRPRYSPQRAVLRDLAPLLPSVIARGRWGCGSS
jgi:hypothetical protein